MKSTIFPVVIYIYILGVARYVPRVQGFGTTGKKKIYYARFLFIYCEQTLVQITIFFQLDGNIQNIITLCYIYIYIYIHIKSAVHIILKVMLYNIALLPKKVTNYVT